MDPESPRREHVEHLPEAERQEIRDAVGRGIISDGLVVGAIPSIIFTITYTYRVGRAVVFNTPTAAIDVDISRVFHTFFEALGSYAPQILAAVIIGFAVPALVYRRLTMSNRTIAALYATTILVAVTSGTGVLLTSWLFVGWFGLVLLTLAIPLFIVVNWRGERGRFAAAQAELAKPTSHRTWIIRTLSRAVAIAMSGAVTAYIMGVSFAASQENFQVVKAVNGKPPDATSDQIVLVVDDYNIILAVVVDRPTRKLTNEIRQYGEFDELSISLEKVGPLDVAVTLNSDDLEIWR